MVRAAVVLIGLTGSIALASMIGVIHDPVTWSISPEYYTALKFWQFHLYPPQAASTADVQHRRCVVARLCRRCLGYLVGRRSVWRRVGSPRADPPRSESHGEGPFRQRMDHHHVGGLLWPHLYHAGLRLPIPPGVTDPIAFARAAVIHSCSYLGGAFGGGLAALYRVIQRLRSR